MATEQAQISGVPTNIITGFLGVGKTTTIINLLKQKPKNETWAVLVNEFGEVGIDGGLLSGQFSEESGIFIREVPGGCMCCTSGLPMQIALAQLLRRARPDRLLIEPTGLGHPKEVLQVLCSEYYRDVLSIQKTVTLVDARQLSNPQYSEHATYKQQLELADVIVGNKSDLYSPEDKLHFQALLESSGADKVTLVLASHGRFDSSLLEGRTLKQDLVSTSEVQMQPWVEMGNGNGDDLPDDGILKVENAGEGYRSKGWRFSPDKVFEHDSLVTLLTGLRVERAKGVFITNQGVFGYNLSDDVLTEMELDDCLESKVEIIFRNDADVDAFDPLQCLM